jgi:hypothetical protein
MAKQLSNGTGVSLGQSTSDVVGFHGVTPIARASLPSALATTTCIKTTGALTYGFSTSAKGQALIDLVVAIRAALINKGIMV